MTPRLSINRSARFVTALTARAVQPGRKSASKIYILPKSQKQSDEELFNATKQGKGKMPAYDKKLTDDQIKQLVKYIRSLK